MSLFGSGLAFADPVLRHASKLAILCASLLAACSGAALLLWHGRAASGAAAPSGGGVGDEGPSQATPAPASTHREAA